MDPEKRSEEYSRPAKHKRRNSIRERTRNALFDIGPIYHNLSETDRDKIFAPVVETMWPWSPKNMLSDGFGFMLLGVLEQTNHDLDDEEFYEGVFEQSIRRTLRKVSHGADNIEVDITIDGWTTIDDFAGGRGLPELRPGMLRSLLEAGEISNEEFAEAILAQQAPGDSSEGG